MDLFGIFKVCNFIYLRFVFDSCSIIKMGMNERRKEMNNSYENYGEIKCRAAGFALISLICTGAIAPGVAAFFIEEKIANARRKRKMDGERLSDY